MHIKTLFLIIFITFGSSLNARQVIIKGIAKSYAGDVLKIKCYEDQISFKEKELASCKVDTDGAFQFKFEIKETLMAFIHLNVFKGIIYVEPDKEYEIVLPKKVNKLPEDEINPYFEESEFYIEVLKSNADNLNRAIEKFQAQYDAYLDKYFYLFKGRLDKAVVDSIVNALEENFKVVDNLFFKDYKEYSYLLLRQIAYERSREKMIENAFFKKPVLYQNPAYMDLFNQVFTNFLAYYSKSPQGKKIPYYLIKEKSLKKIKQALSDTSVLQDDNLQDLIIAKSLYDNFYKDDYPQESIIFMLDSVRIASKSAETRLVVQNMLNKLTTLCISYPAPDFELPDKSNKLHSLEGLRGKFVYLSFVNPKSYSCLQDLEVLNRMVSKKYDMLEVVTICVCNNIEEMQKFVREKSYNWKFLFYSNNHDLLKDYNVKAYPTYYLINPEGRLAMSPAFSPAENSFEARYADMLKAWKVEIQNRKTKGLQN